MNVITAILSGIEFFNSLLGLKELTVDQMMVILAIICISLAIISANITIFLTSVFIIYGLVRLAKYGIKILVKWKQDKLRKKYHIVRKEALKINNYLLEAFGPTINAFNKFMDDQAIKFRKIVDNFEIKVVKLFAKKDVDDFFKESPNLQKDWGKNTPAYYYNLFKERINYLDDKLQ